MGNTVRYHWVGLQEMINELDRVTLKDRTYEVVGPLEQVLAEAFAATQMTVASPAHPHVATYAPTGNLMSSGRTHSDFDGRTWTGEIEYLADYGIYEQARGGVHDWMAIAPYEFSKINDVMMDHFRGDLS
jgi:hypothetical protein